MGFSQALSGMNAASQQLDTIGNNIANSQTSGFKSSSVQFADVYASSKVGLGTSVAGILQDFGNGTLETTDRDLDLGISGDGFFRFQSGDTVGYSRNGQLTMTTDGYLANAQGAYLTGYNVQNFNSSTTAATVATGGQPEVIQIPSGSISARATTSASASIDLDASDDAITADFDADDADTYNYATSTTVYDSLGVAHNLQMYFTKTDDNTWTVNTSLDGTTDPTTTTPSTTLLFDENGRLQGVDDGTGTGTTDGSALSFTFPGTDGAAELSFDFDFDGSTQTEQSYAISSPNQDGYASGQLVGISIDSDGTINGSYSNDQTVALGRVALADFANTEGLQPIGDNLWQATTASGQAVIGTAGNGSFGSLQSGTLEASNVDLSQELVNLIIAQRNFQANSNTIKTQDEVLQTVVNLR
ncbi:flagellar hook protein FlgE [Salinicola rhizosphaerae]|uniref:Flagellar hook protein FlgE n=1 Tax=Salinicola rhizosphaerae TaxID=1443141 RepID=A0ABQ3DNX4_9GAMM|nr:flagellar hook protein FlgE [Salinicola rhizosphaerae]GHB08558.1 flagellar hook protein FlgE [Salinicola rhizosphaerae]